MTSAYNNPQPVEDYLAAELVAGRIIGPIDPKTMPKAQVSRFGVIPKANQPGKWRLILDLSSPNNRSVNDGIPKELHSMQYASIDDAVDMIMQTGQGCLLAKIDIEHVDRNIPVHTDDRPLLALERHINLYIDTVLPFGLRSAPKIFSAVADALEWILQQYYGVSFILHYLDDFLTMGKAGTPECQKNLDLIIEICTFLGLPLKFEKIEGPLPILIFLGILLNSIKQEI